MKFRLKGSDQVTGFLDKGTHVRGELEFTGTLRIDGQYHGSISTGDILVIGEHATVHADIKAGEVEINGQVFGNIEAKRRVELFASARVRGDISTPVLAVSPGATFDGRLRMAGDRAEETTVAARSTSEQNIRHERR